MSKETATDGQFQDHADREDGPNGSRLSPAVTEADIVPPPPSAPGEFLGAQWLVPVPRANGEPSSPVTLTPPPASAPSEFLSAQWGDLIESSHGGDGQVLADFEAAFPAMILSVEELEELALSDGEGQAQQELGGPDEGPEVQEIADGPTATRIRGVPLAAGEEIVRVFLPDSGVSSHVPQTGQALILSNRRLIAFRGVEGFRDTHMAMSSEIVQCSVRTGQRNWGAILQGVMVMVGGAFLYLIVGYWLAGQISGPNVPVLNIDVAPLIALLIIIAGLFILLQNYFTRPAGAMIFHGEGMEIAFPFRSSLELEQVYDFVDLAQEARMRASPSARNGADPSH